MHLTRDLIQFESINNDAQDFHSGASVIFFGMVRDHSDGKNVSYLEYEAYESMAEKTIQNLIRQAHEEWPLDHIKLLHRIGRVNLGEIAVLIDVRATHRDEVYQASRFLIEKIKHAVPIWKKEYFLDGTSEWSLCHHVNL